MRWVRRDMYAWNAGGGDEIRAWWVGWVFHELSSSETPNKKEISEERVEARASRAGLYVGERTSSLAFAVKPSSSALGVDIRTQRSMVRIHRTSRRRRTCRYARTS